MKPKQQNMLIYIAGYINQHNQAPTLREIANDLGYKDPSCAAFYIHKLIDSGYIENNGKKRGLNIVKSPMIANPIIHASIQKAIAWEWRRDIPIKKNRYVKKGYRKTNPKLIEYHKKRKAGEL